MRQDIAPYRDIAKRHLLALRGQKFLEGTIVSTGADRRLGRQFAEENDNLRLYDFELSQAPLTAIPKLFAARLAVSLAFPPCPAVEHVGRVWSRVPCASERVDAVANFSQKLVEIDAPRRPEAPIRPHPVNAGLPYATLRRGLGNQYDKGPDSGFVQVTRRRTWDDIGALPTGVNVVV